MEENTTELNTTSFKDKKIHFIGIAGISMNSIARLLNSSMGAIVSGSDMQENLETDIMVSEGIKVYNSHSADNVRGMDLIVKNSAILDDNPELCMARKMNIPVIERSEMIGYLMQDYKNVVCISGSHGKTTTTSMISNMAIACAQNPTIMVGTQLDIIGGSLKIGGKGLFINESCEYCNSFHNFRPTVAVLLNIEADHLDFFNGLPDIISSFNKFAALVPQNSGVVVANFDDDNVIAAVSGINRKILTFGFNQNSFVYPSNILCNNGYYSFDIICNGVNYGNINLNVPGRHNVYNALASFCVGYYLGFDNILDGISGFAGSSRRFQRVMEYNGVVVIDDYAHHPTEILATLSTAKQMDYNRVIVAFQSHTYTRTHELLQEFADSLKIADVVILSEIYAAREKNVYNISGKDIADRIDGAEFYSSFNEIAERIIEISSAGDLVIIMGAGDINKVHQIMKEMI